MESSGKITVKQIERYMSEWRTRNDIREKFDLSNTESYRLIRWFDKLGILETVQRTRAGHQNKVYLYKIKQE